MRVRVGNTDAEGRMAMADPLHYSKKEVSLTNYNDAISYSESMS